MSDKIIVVKGNQEKKISPDELKAYESTGWKKWTVPEKPGPKSAGKAEPADGK